LTASNWVPMTARWFVQTPKCSR